MRRPYYEVFEGVRCFLGFHDWRIFDMMLGALVRHKKKQLLIIYRCVRCFRKRYCDWVTNADWMEWMDLQNRDFYKPLLTTPINSLFVQGGGATLSGVEGD